MTKQVQRRRGTATQHTSFTGAEGEISVNTTNKSVHVHDGVTAGGVEAARADLSNVSDANLNNALSGNTLASLTITSADINGGTIDGVTIGGASAGAGTFTSVTGTSLNLNGAAVFNESGADVDFRIESDTNAYAFFLQGSDGYVGIGDSEPPTILSVKGDTPESRITNTNNIADTAGTEEVARLGVYGQKNSIYGPVASIVVRQDASTWSSVETYQKGTRIEFCTQDTSTTDTSETPRMVIDKDGNVGIGTSSPTNALDVNGNIAVSGGVYLGGTAAANLLEDYEEGTWTPAFTAETGTLDPITYTHQTGNYTKIGRQVTVTGRMTTSGAVTIGTASGDIRITGLPFTVGNAEAFHSAASLSFVFSWNAGNAPSSAYVVKNSTHMTMMIRNDGSDGTETEMTASEFVAGANNGCHLMFTATYFTG